MNTKCYTKSAFKLFEKLTEFSDEKLNSYLEGSRSTEDQRLFYDDDFYCIIDPELDGKITGSKVCSTYVFKDVDADDCLVKVEFHGVVSAIEDNEITVVCDSVKFYEYDYEKK